ncbi:hypothetical protein VB780_06680 [Leptolyngbya sp. CCNP1308]|uniref:hypothetical protein n=1 Tax=Leptolyngbya sp. CCNP1308 TaxID=3110255 RepID=UPI002B1EE224|nr:hypothetical protein [Leptolyngbya sp. CCNP1308]MEA5448248.1 hypothetical protein [Leptolyngbya sp. CCNP1308]
MGSVSLIIVASGTQFLVITRQITMAQADSLFSPFPQDQVQQQLAEIEVRFYKLRSQISGVVG